MKRKTHSEGGALRLLLTLVAAALILPTFARAARLSGDELPAAVQGEAETTVTVEDFGAVGDGVHDDAEAIENALNSGAAKVEFGAGKTYLYKKAIVMTASNVEIAGNRATLEWDSETPFEDWRELMIASWEPESPVTNIYLHHLNFLTPNMSVERVSSVQLLLFNCSGVRVEDCGFLITEGGGNEANADGGRGATNIWIYGDCHNVTVRDCALRNLSHASGSPVAGDPYLGAGGNVWVSGYTDANTPDSSISDISILNNRIEKSCHDESIAVWSAEAERILIDGNEFDIHEKEDGVLDYSDMIFTFGNLEGCAEGKTDTVKDVHFTHNTVRAESRNYLFLCGGGEGSEPVDISDNDITWTKVGSMNSFVGLVHTGRNFCDVVFKGNRVLLEDSGDSGEFYKLFSSRRTKVVGNTVTVNRQFAHICDLDDGAAAQNDTSSFENNHFIINAARAGNYLYQGYEFHDNAVEFNSVSPNEVFNFYEITFSRNVAVANLSGNRIVFRGVCGNASYGRTALTLGKCTLNGCDVDISGNEFYTTVPQSGDEAYALVSVSGLTDGNAQIIRATDVRSNLFDQLWIDEVSAVRVVTDAGEYSAWTRLPLTESVAAVLSDGALSYAVTAPELSGVSLFAVSYDNDGRMLSCASPELAAPDSGVPWARGEISFASLFPPESAADAQTVRLFLLKRDTPSPVCKPWIGDLSA